MNTLRALLVLAVALVLQAGLGRLFPGSHRYIDVLLVPVALYGIASSQRSAMLVGCGAGLLTDAWFLGGPFGLSGFKRTLLGWMLGAVASRFDLNQFAGRFVAGVVVTLVDELLDLLLRGLLDAHPHLPGPTALLIKACSTGLLVAAGGAILERTGREPRTPRFV